MNFSSWGTLQGNDFIWISWCGTPHKMKKKIKWISVYRAPLYINNFIWISLLGAPYKATISYEFLYLGHPTNEQFQMNFFIWETPRRRNFIWISFFIGHLYIKKNIYEFLFLGHSTRQRFHMNFLMWDTPQNEKKNQVNFCL